MGAAEHLPALRAAPMAPLIATPQWIVVLLVPLPNNKTNKIPVDFRTANVGVDAHDPKHWTDYETAKTTAEMWGGISPNGGFTAGFVLTEDDNFWCLDIDNALQPDGTWSALSQQLCAALPSTCIEVSQSGHGLHVWGQGAVPPHAKKNIPLGIELYTERRFIAIGHSAVGDMTQPCPTIAAVAAYYFPPRTAAATNHNGDGPRPEWRGPTDDDELIRRMLASRSAAGAFGGGVTPAQLWHADAEALGRRWPADGRPYDASSADAAMAQHLAWWTGCDQPRMNRLMRQSALYREKWDSHGSYLDRTIANACAQQRDVLQDKPPPAPPVPITSDAPTMRPAEGNRFLSSTEQAALFRGCVYVADHHRALVPGGNLLKPEQFRAKFGGYTFAMDDRNERTTRNAWEAFTESQVLTAPRADGTCFRPDLPYGEIVHNEGRSRVNTYWPIDVRRVVGSIEPFDHHLRLLLPHDWPILLYFMAGAVQFPGVKFQWMPLLIGVEGNGKSFFSRCVARAIGQRYTHWVAADKIDGRFNEWLFGKLFYAIEDLKIGSNAAAWEKLKPLITGENVEIEGKGIDQRSDEICGNFIANSNHFDAIRATRNDRRVAHLHCAQQSVDDLARDGIDERYTHALYEWAEGDGYAIVAEHLHTLPIPPEFGKGWLTGRAPKTSSTAAAIEHGRSPVEQAILDAIDEERPGFCGGWISSVMLGKLLEGKRLLGQFPPVARDGVLRGLGYGRHPALGEKGQTSHPVAPDGAKPRLYIKDGHSSLALQRPADIARAYSAAQGVI